MRSWIAPLALLAACGFRAPTVPTDGGDGGVDTPPDTPVIPPDAQQCFGPFLNVCLSALPTTAITVQVTDPDLDINTDMGATASPLSWTCGSARPARVRSAALRRLCARRCTSYQ